MLDANSYRVIIYLLNSQTYSSIDMIAESLAMSRRSVYYSINTINSLLEEHGYQRIESRKYYGIQLSSQARYFLKKELSKYEPSITSYFGYAQRAALIVISLYNHPLSIIEIADLCKVSSRTSQDDMHRLSKELKQFSINLKHKSNRYRLQGNNIVIRTVVMYYLDTVLDMIKQGYIGLEWMKSSEQMFDLLRQIEKGMDLQLKDNIVRKLAYVVGVNKISSEDFSGYLDEIEKSPLFERVSQSIPQLSFDEKYYITMIMTSTRLTELSPEVSKQLEDNVVLLRLVEQIINIYEEMGRVSFINKEELKASLRQHIYYSQRLYKYGLVDVNVLKDEISVEYRSIYQLTELVLSKCSSRLGYPLTEDEIAYMTLLFGAHLDTEDNRSIRVLVVCASGVSTSLMIKNEIMRLSNAAQILATIGIDKLNEYEHRADLIVSTLSIDTSTPSIMVNPVFTQADRIKVLNSLEMLGENRVVEIQSRNLMKQLLPYIKEGKEKEVSKLIDTLKENRYINAPSYKEISLEDIADKISFDVYETASSWEEAILISGKHLKERKLITQDYLDTCIKGIVNNGAYSILPNRVYLAHARPEDGVYDLSIGMSYFKSGIIFPDENVIDFVLILATPDYTSHINVLNELVTLFSTDEFVARIKNFKGTHEEFMNIIERYLA